MYLYANSGITAYVLADGGLRFDLIYLSQCEALKTQSPGVVFLDMSAIHYTFCLKEEEAHRTLENISLYWEKIAYAMNNTCKNLTFWNVLFPFFRYHTRWDSLTSTDFDYLTGNVDASYTRGHYISYTSVAAEYEFYDEAEEDRLTLSDVYGLEYLYRIYELCEEHDIELILYKIPSATWYESNSEVSGEVAAELGLWYWELFYELDEIGLDAETDFVDGIEHLNQPGAEKVTDYLMQYLLENYELTDWRGINTRWDEDLIAYQALLK